jgi:hypothetical protein
MNVVLHINNYSNDNIYLLDSKQNIITDGIFTKIIFSNKLFAMNGIFLFFPIDTDNIINSNGRYFIHFNPNSSHNSDIIKNVYTIEDNILDLYKNTNNIKKKKTYVLNNQLFTGNIKVYKDNYDSSQDIFYSNKLFILKISGIWENDFEFGITYKIIIAKKLSHLKY